MNDDQNEAHRRAGQQLKEFRLSAGLSQEELATDAGVDQSKLSKVERLGPYVLRWEAIHALAESLGCVLELNFRKIK